MRISLHHAFLALVAGILLAGMVPGWIVLDRRLSRAIESQAREHVAMAPALLADRESMASAMAIMHARELSSTPGLAQAVRTDARDRALELLTEAASSLPEAPLLLVGTETWVGTLSDSALVAATQDGAEFHAIVPQNGALIRVALVPLFDDGLWLGAVGVTDQLGDPTAGVLAGLTLSDVIVLLGPGGVAASTASEDVAATIARDAYAWRGDGDVHTVRGSGGRRFLAATANLEPAGAVVFVRDLDTELAVIPRLRRTAAVSALFVLTLALLLGTGAATVLARPVRALAHAAERVSAGDFETPLQSSAVREIDRVASAFDEMRRSLAARLDELEAANRELAERQDRLRSLQAELMQRDRLAASGRLLAGLAHEIRNPIANVRNCLEVVRRRLHDDETGREFADMAIDELLRMHELAERILDLNRPRDTNVLECDASSVSEEVAALVKTGFGSDDVTLAVEAPEAAPAAIPPDDLKQVLLNLTQNAYEAVGARGTIEIAVAVVAGGTSIEVRDDGPGIPSDVLNRIFDPFFTTKTQARGVGLGLFLAEGIARRHGGRLTAHNRGARRGSLFRLEVPRAAGAAGDATDRAAETQAAR
jgi:two-component system NtrC family sensor kinase